MLCCSDILTPLPALGVPFEIDDVKGPIIAEPVRSLEQVMAAMDTSDLVQRSYIAYATLRTLQVKRLHPVDLKQLQFVGDALTSLRQEVNGQVNSHIHI